MKFRHGITERFVTRDAATPAYRPDVIGGGEALTRLLARFDPPAPNQYIRLEYGEGAETGSGNSPVSSTPFEVVLRGGGPETAPMGSELHAMHYGPDPKLTQLQGVLDRHYSRDAGHDADVIGGEGDPAEPGERRNTLYRHTPAPGEKLELRGPDELGFYDLVLVSPPADIPEPLLENMEGDEYDDEYDLAEGAAPAAAVVGDRRFAVRHCDKLSQLNRANARFYDTGAQAMTTAEQQQFEPGADLIWVNRAGGPGATLTRRSVKFISLNGSDEAIVAWGMTPANAPQHHVVKLAELSHPQRPAPAWGAAPAEQPEYRPPPPPSLSGRRDALRRAHEAAADARDAVLAATATADRARVECDAARAGLAELTLRDSADLELLEAALRAGKSPELETPRLFDVGAAQRRVTLTEAALVRFDSELNQANTDLEAALSSVRRAAAAVLTSLLDREAVELQRIEAEAMRRRAELVSAARWHPSGQLVPLQLAAPAAALLSNPPSFEEPPGWDRAGEAARTAKWRNVYDRLVQGEAGADFAS